MSDQNKNQKLSCKTEKSKLLLRTLREQNEILKRTMIQPTTPSIWPRAVIHVDMNAFFASIEQKDKPHWAQKPVAVTNGEEGSCIITCSYEARAKGVKTGMRLYEAKGLCPELIQAPSRPERYAQVSQQIMQIAQDITPQVEVFSVDEAFLDVQACQLLHGSPVKIGRLLQKRIQQQIGLPCSIGVSGDKTTAKYAAKLKKPRGFSVIPPWQARERLSQVPVDELCGINHGIKRFLARYQAHTCGDVAKLPISVLAQRFGNKGRRIWHMCQGKDPEPVEPDVPAPKSLGHGKVLPPQTQSRKTVTVYFLHMATKLAMRLRRHAFVAQHFYVGFKAKNLGWYGNHYKTETVTDDEKIISELCKKMLVEQWDAQIVQQVQITALDPQTANHQLDLFIEQDERRFYLNKVKDAINQKFGDFTLQSASLLERSAMPNVISPAWRPDGVRQSV